MEHKKSAGFLLKLINENLEKKMNRKLKPFGLTQSQGRVLGYLREQEGQKTSQKDIENYFEVSHPTVVGILKRLEQNGFITCEFDSQDRRVKNVYLTQKEAIVHAEMCNFQKKTDAELFDGISAEEGEKLVLLLRRVCENLR